eukprot:7426083-Pyramimonas_sp.AAC.1
MVRSPSPKKNETSKKEKNRSSGDSEILQNMRMMMSEYQGSIINKLDEPVGAIQLQLAGHTQQIADIQNDMVKQQIQISDQNDELKRLAREVTGMKSGGTASSWGDGGSTRGGGSDAGGARQQQSDATIRFMGTFPRPLLREQRKHHYDTVIFPRFQHLLENVKGTFQGLDQSYKFKFPTAVAAKVLQQARNEAGGHEWRDPRTSTTVPTRCRQDLPIDVRIRQRSFYVMHDPFLRELQKSAKWQQGCRLGVNGFKGVLQVIGLGDVWELVKTVKSGIGQES